MKTVPKNEMLPPVKTTPFGSSAQRLRGKEWLATAVLALLICWGLPRLWPRIEPFTPGPDYRLPYALSSDYFMVRRWYQHAVREYPVVMIGDSVTWGEYVRADETLPACMNRLAPGGRVANLGLGGAYPAALAGLVEYYGNAVTGTKVILHLNPLWMSSPETDLSGDNEARINHPRLLPQFVPLLKPYKAKGYKVWVEEGLSAVIERNTPILQLAEHLRLAYFDSMDIQGWVLQNPAHNPASAITLKLPEATREAKSRPVPWTAGDRKKQVYAWVPLDKSFQFAAFRATVRRLQKRGNRVFVLVGPFNTHMLTEGSARRYADLQQGINAWLNANHIPCHAAAVLPADEYADASHPLAAGYQRLAQALQADPAFQTWLVDKGDLPPKLGSK